MVKLKKNTGLKKLCNGVQKKRKKNILTSGLLIVFKMMTSTVYLQEEDEYVVFAKIICHKTYWIHPGFCRVTSHKQCLNDWHLER